MKRTEKFNFQNVAKKQKIEECSEDVWGDDLEFDEVDKCISLASQMCQELQSNSLISYDDFKINAKASTSTQAFLIPAIPSSSKTPFLNNEKLNSSSVSISTVINSDLSTQEYQKKLLQDIKRLEELNKKLTEKCELKDGENSILRTQLRQAQKTVETEKLQKLEQTNRINQQWDEKYNLLVKEKDRFECDVHLKQVEIMNIKDKFKDIQVHNITLNNSLHLIKDSPRSIKRMNSSGSSVSSKKTVTSEKTDISTIVTQTIVLLEDFHFPLQQLIPVTIFEKSQINHSALLKLKSSIDSRNLLRHNSFLHENIINFRPVEVNKMILSAECFFMELMSLMRCSDQELNFSNVSQYINKIILVTRELLVAMLSFLRRVENNKSNEDINAIYLLSNDTEETKSCLFSQKPWNEQELGIELRRCIAVLSVITNLNSYLMECLTKQAILKQSNTERYFNYQKTTRCDILPIIQEITQAIGKIGHSDQFSGFLSSILCLLNSLLQDKELNPECCKMIHVIYKEIIFIRPNSSTSTYISSVLFSTSFHKELVQILCENSSRDTFQTNQNHFIFKQETCLFNIAMVLLDTYRSNVYIVGDVLNFLLNAFTSNPTWMHPQEQRCYCLYKLCSMSIELLYDLTKTSLKNKRSLSKNEKSILKTGLLVIIELSYRNTDLIISDLQMYRQYFKWIRQMKSTEKKLCLETDTAIALETLLSYICIDDDEATSENSNREEDFKTDVQLIM